MKYFKYYFYIFKIIELITLILLYYKKTEYIIIYIQGTNIKFEKSHYYINLLLILLYTI